MPRSEHLVSDMKVQGSGQVRLALITCWSHTKGTEHSSSGRTRKMLHKFSERRYHIERYIYKRFVLENTNSEKYEEIEK